MEDASLSPVDDTLLEQWRSLDGIVDRLTTALLPEELLPKPGEQGGRSVDIEALRRRVAILEQENDELLDLVVSQRRDIERLRRSHSDILESLRDAHAMVERLQSELG